MKYDPFEANFLAMLTSADPRSVAKGKQALATCGVMVLPSRLIERVQAFTVRCEGGWKVCPEEFFAITHAVELAERAVRLGLYVIEGGRRFARADHGFNRAAHVGRATLRLVA